MEVIQPLDIETSYRTLSVNGDHFMVVSSKLFFPLEGGDPLTGSQAYGTLQEQAVAYNDELHPKLSTEFLVVGNIQAPAGQAVTALQAEVSLAGLNKSLKVIGDRYWVGGLTGATEPVPFTTMPISWECAFGGNGVDHNPLGKGRAEQSTPLGQDLICLPNIEYPDNPTGRKGQQVTPASFSAIPPDWPQRARYLGTYDDIWQRDAFPGFPADFDFRAFYCASDDQRFDQYLNGGEPFTLTHLNADNPQLLGTLPEFRVRNFLTRQLQPQEIKPDDLLEVPMRLDTVVFYPNHKLGMLIYRGSVPSETLDGEHLKYLLSGYEARAASPRPKDHYHQSLVGRTHPEFAMQYALTTRDLIPDNMPCSLARMTQTKEQPAQLIADNMKNRALREEAEARADVEQQTTSMIQALKDQGMETSSLEKQLAATLSGGTGKDEWQQRFDAVLEKLIPGANNPDGIIDLQKIDFRAFDELSRLSEEYAHFQKEQAKQHLSDQIQALPHSPDTQRALKQALTDIDLPPLLPRPEDPEGLIQQIRQAQLIMQNQQNRGHSQVQANIKTLDTEAIEAALQQGNDGLRDAYRLGAHSMGFGRPPLDSEQQRLEFERRQAAGESHLGQDYAGVDFSGLDLSGIDFRYCYLEQCRFDQCNLAGANLSGSIAVRSSFIAANLNDADFSDASIGACDFTQASLIKANLDNCEYSAADFSSANLSHTRLTVINSLEVTFKGCNLSHCEFSEPTFINTDFSRANFSHSNMKSATFINCQLNEALFNEADCNAVNFIECQMKRSRFTATQLTNARFMMATDLEGSDFLRARLDHSNLRQACIRQVNFSEASMLYADLSGANAEAAIFNAADLRHSQCLHTQFVSANLSNCNLMEASLMQANLQRASIRRSNCYGVEFMGAIVSHTDFSGSNMDASKLQDWRPSKWQS